MYNYHIENVTKFQFVALSRFIAISEKSRTEGGGIHPPPVGTGLT